ncbi:ABC transporter substrate-binding protein [Legionella sp. km772]|uniref:ABC transporter substrate-binding protein n=1 Tax=Legionella sp. km772 TaxID=2498111 RepID=UPI000F8E96BB|nr:ABC transporter substrate-binding protein [Legionella sp. km772]RUR10295.1 peptide ABC transporter substrate-binding protein [Legionella sp. km772]
MVLIRIIILLLIASELQAFPWVLNNPYPDAQSKQNIYYSSFTEQPKTLDPARSYSANEYLFIGQIYEPLLEYHYQLRPYQLSPLTAAAMPQLRFLNEKGETIALGEGVSPAFSVYTISIQKGIFYQPHPAFAKNKKGQFLYHHLDDDYLDEHDISKLADFKKTGTRELRIDDYIYQIKRLANPAVGSPVYGLMSDYIVGFADYGKTLPRILGEGSFLDLRQYPLKGIKKIDDYTFEITLKGQYSQFLFWLAMPFFSPIPWEADLFYSQYDMDDKNLTFNWYPVGTGPFMLSDNNPNRAMLLEKNPNYRPVFFPTTDPNTNLPISSPFVGKRLPLIDKAIYTLEKESIPRWNKFLQGYYDASGISADSFDQALHINSFGEPVLSQEMRDKKMHLIQTLEPSIFYMGFNMLDPIIGGNSERARKLRQAISIAVNYDESIAIFYNGRGRAAQGPIPPGIYGYKEGEAGINPYVYKWVNNAIQRRPLDDAKQLLTEAGYDRGIDPKTNKPLILNYDVTTSGSPEDKAILDWMRKQFANIGIDLNVHPTLYNRFQEKMRTGDIQIFSWGWNADYPDPENFFFQLYSRNSKVKYGGENAANYNNPEFDHLFELMKNRSNDQQRQTLIDQMLEIVRHDAPWVWGMHQEQFTLLQDWVANFQANSIYLSTLKYVAVDVSERNKLRTEWNQPIFWPLILLAGLMLLLILPLVFTYYQKERLAAPRMSIK